MTKTEIEELRKAYNLLNVPCSASKGSIKHAYRHFAKRWHPDRYAGGTPAHAEATQMMKLINESYSQIASAPLRYYDEQTAGSPPQTGSEGSRASGPYVQNPDVDNPYGNDPYVTDTETRSKRRLGRIGAWFRFVAGGVFGVYVVWVLYVSLRVARHPVLAAVLVVAAFLSGGFAMVRYGANVRWGRW